MTTSDGAAAVVEVGGVGAHARPGAAVLAERQAGLHADFLERPIAAVAIELVRLGVVRHEQIGPAVQVEVEHGDAERLRGRIEQPRRGGHVFEGPVALVAIEPRRRPGVGFGRAIRLRLAVGAAEDVGLGGPADVVADHQIEQAVAVVVDPQGRGAEPGALAQARPVGDVDESSVAGVAGTTGSVRRR